MSYFCALGDMMEDGRSDGRRCTGAKGAMGNDGWKGKCDRLWKVPSKIYEGVIGYMGTANGIKWR
jgi:hypothetical protein